MANVAASTIVELSEMVNTQWNEKYAQYINAAAKVGNTFSTEIPTKRQGVHVPFINVWKTLTKIELNQKPDYETVVMEYINRKIARYAKGIEISLYDWEDPAAQALLWQQLDAIAAEAAWLRTRRVMYALNNGDTSAVPAYDGQNLFSNSHTLNGATFDNLLSGTLSTATFNNAKTVLRKIPLGDDGTYLPTELAKFYLVVPPALEADARLIIESTTIPEDYKTALNPYLGAAEIVVNSLLTDDNDWYLIMTLPGLTPFMTVRHVTSKPALIPKIAKTDLNVMEEKMYRWLLDIAEETYPIHFFQMVKVVNA